MQKKTLQSFIIDQSQLASKTAKANFIEDFEIM